MDTNVGVADDRGVQTSAVRVLLVDDAACFRELAREVLQHRGYVVIGEADCTKSARRAVATLAPDALLLDVDLPDGNGFELATELEQAYPRLVILLVSARLPPERDLLAAHMFVEKSQLARVDLTRFLPPPGG